MAKKLAGEATNEELQELDELIRENPQLNFSNEIMLDFWQAGLKTDSQYVENKYRELIQQIKNIGADDGKFIQDDHIIDYNNYEQIAPGGKKRNNSILVLSSLVIVAIITSLYFFQPQQVSKGRETIPEPQANEISTKSGSKTTLLLPDGTKVWLNANSKISYDKGYGNKLREVVLAGEAYFDVVKNADKPFIIHTHKMDIKVLGTMFNVKCYPGEKTTETSLIRGSIEVTLKDRQEKIMLKPNEKLVVNNDEIIASELLKAATTISKTGRVKRDNPIMSLGHLTFYPVDSTVIETAWVENKFVFSSETFEEIALKMERWYNVKIAFADESLKNERLTGNFEKETINEALTAMQLTTSFSFTIKNENIVIKKK